MAFSRRSLVHLVAIATVMAVVVVAWHQQHTRYRPVVPMPLGYWRGGGIPPNPDDPGFQKETEKAISYYKGVLRQNPENLDAVKTLGMLYLQLKRYEDAKVYERRAIQIDPNVPELYYIIAVIDWTEAYTPIEETKRRLNVKPNAPIGDRTTCDELKGKNSQAIEEGMAMLAKALQLRHDYDDAMAYMNLLWREKADIECGDLAARRSDLKKADEWVEKAIHIKTLRARDLARASRQS